VYLDEHTLDAVTRYFRNREVHIEIRAGITCLRDTVEQVEQ
jgi:hypothetical protein